MNKKMRTKAQFDSLVLKEKDDKGNEKEKNITDQKQIGWEVRKFYWNLYRGQEVVIDWDEIKKMTSHLKTMSEAEKIKLESEITINEVSQCLKNTRNNVAPGTGGFSGTFYKVFWCYLKYVVLGAMHQIYKDKQISISLRLGIIALIPKGTKDKR